ncbi:MAG: pyridoxal phosphate-dependent class II aminotransferase [Nitrospinae bacterium]|nr:pyridoxal phosphate-dependent class II aminotransferase [Nitrospinota bacterium]
MLEGHGGNIHEAARIAGCLPSGIIDLSSNISPFPPSRIIMDRLKEGLREISALPEVASQSLAGLVARRHNLSEGQVLIGNGTTELIFSLPRSPGSRSALICAPTYSDYADSCRLSSVETRFLFCRKEENFEFDLRRLRTEAGKADLVFLCNPNNPTGALVGGESLRGLIRLLPSTTFIIDESYLPFVEGGDADSMLKGDIPDNLIVLRSFSKIHAIPGLRLGWLASSERTVETLRSRMLPWSVNRLAQIAGEAILESAQGGNLEEDTARYMAVERTEFLARLAPLMHGAGAANPLAVYPGKANFLLFELKGTIDAPVFFNLMLKRRILVRDCSNFRGLGSRFFRISLKTREMNSLCIDAMLEILG